MKSKQIDMIDYEYDHKYFVIKVFQIWHFFFIKKSFVGFVKNSNKPLQSFTTKLITNFNNNNNDMNI
jgi:hypothetical protein